MELYKKTALELSAMLRNKQASAVEITQSVLDRIAQTDDETGAYLTVCNESALKKAGETDRKLSQGQKLPLLAGIPVGIKDNICTKGIKTTCASRMLENFTPPYNAHVIDKLDENGAVIIGKNNMDEFAIGSSTETSYFKKTKNPHNPEYISGGSSGGSAAAVANYSAVCALGSDTGGSIRQPAAFCGVVGLKPTYGTVSRSGLVAFASTLDQIGPIARTVGDAALLYSAICGYDKADATSVNREYPDFAQNLDPDVKGLKIGIPREYFENADEETGAAIYAAIDEYKRLGADVREITLPSSSHASSVYYTISCAEAASNLARFDGVRYGYRTSEYGSIDEMYEKTRSEGFGDEVKRRIMIGTFVLSADNYDRYFKRAKIMQNKLSGEFKNAFKECDVIMSPVFPMTAFKLGENIDDPLKRFNLDICAVTANLAGLPAISIPVGKNSIGLPIGMQIIGNRFDEQLLLNTAYAYEKQIGLS